MSSSNSEEIEKQIIDIIVDCREKLGMGYRKISKELVSRGFEKISKDTVRSKYMVYAAAHKRTNNEASDKEFRVLKKREARQSIKTELAKQKNESRLRIAKLKVEEFMQDINKRGSLFEDDYRLFQFVEKTVAVIHPTIWFLFGKLCENKDYDMINEVWRAVGNQEEFERQNSEKTISLDEYIANCLQKRMNVRKQEESRKQIRQFKQNKDYYIDSNGDYVISIYK
jgi:hypothetical protein